MLTIGHADSGKPTLKDDERPFRYGLFCDLKMNAKMNAKSMPVSYSMNAKLTKLNTKFDHTLVQNTMLYQRSCSK